MQLLLNSVYGMGLKHAARGRQLASKGILCGPQCVFRNFK